jgi:hypothetical protein
MMPWSRADEPLMPDGSQVRTDAPDAPDARVLALDIGAYGHLGSISSMFWYHGAGGTLHAHLAELLPEGATVQDQLDVLEELAESYEEYREVAPVVVVGVTVLSPVGKREVREHLDAWYNPPWRRKLVTVGDYAAEQAGTTARGLTPRKKLRDLIAQRLTERTITLTPAQFHAVSLYTGRRQKPGRDADDEWRTDEVDAIALPVALSCLAAKYLLPPPAPSPGQRARMVERARRAWQFRYGLPEDEARHRAETQGHPDMHTSAADPNAGASSAMRLRPDPTQSPYQQRKAATP